MYLVHVRPLNEMTAVIAGISCSCLMEKKSAPNLAVLWCARVGSIKKAT